MPSRAEIKAALAHTIDRIPLGGPDRFSGKVRDIYALGEDQMAIVVTDRVSVFDHVIGTVPFKGRMLNLLASWWFGKLDEIAIPHHLLSTPHPNISVARRATPLPIELVVRAYLTGTTTTSSWYAYQHNRRMICDIEMPAGMRKNEPFADLMVTPTTKPTQGHDLNISRKDILGQGLVNEAVLGLAEQYALRMFRHGQQAARERGLILVDTKYEMGLGDDGTLIVIDEVHTPDSSRYWVANTYDDRMRLGAEPDGLDKEFVRRSIIGAGYDVDSADDPAKYFSDDMRVDAALKYADLFDKITGAPANFSPTSLSDVVRVLETLRRDAGT
jgi:phosphoribosylaminoimidazole-succinocarboxamide synthase